MTNEDVVTDYDVCEFESGYHNLYSSDSESKVSDLEGETYIVDKEKADMIVVAKYESFLIIFGELLIIMQS